MPNVAPFLAWLEATPWAIGIKTSGYLFPLIESLHVNRSHPGVRNDRDHRSTSAGHRLQPAPVSKDRRGRFEMDLGRVCAFCGDGIVDVYHECGFVLPLSLIHISEPTRQAE